MEHHPLVDEHCCWRWLALFLYRTGAGPVLSRGGRVARVGACALTTSAAHPARQHGGGRRAVCDSPGLTCPSSTRRCGSRAWWPGKGWIALALTTLPPAAGAVLLLEAYPGGVTMLQFHLQKAGASEIASQWLSMPPYLATIAVLVLISRNPAWIASTCPRRWANLSCLAVGPSPTLNLVPWGGVRMKTHDSIRRTWAWPAWPASLALTACGKKEEAAPAALQHRLRKGRALKVAFASVGPVGDGGWTNARQRPQALEKEFGDKIVTNFVEGARGRPTPSASSTTWWARATS